MAIIIKRKAMDPVIPLSIMSFKLLEINKFCRQPNIAKRRIAPPPNRYMAISHIPKEGLKSLINSPNIAKKKAEESMKAGPLVMKRE